MFDFLDNDTIVLNLIIKYVVPKNIVDNWKSILNIINEPVHHELLELFSDECKNKIYEYINNIKTHYLKYSQIELDTILKEYNHHKKEYLQDLYLLYRIPENLKMSIEYSGNFGFPFQDPRKELMTDKQLILEDIMSIVKSYALESNSRGTLLFVKKLDNKLQILNSTCANLDKFSLPVHDVKNVSIVNADSTNFTDIEVEMQYVKNPINLSKFYIIPFSDIIKLYEPKKFVFKYDEIQNKFYLHDTENNELIYNVDFIKEKVSLSELSIDTNLPHVELYELDYILNKSDDDYTIWCVGHRGYDVINYDFGIDGYIRTDGYQIDSYDYEHEYYKPELIKRYLAGDSTVIIYWNSFFKKGISKQQLELYMNEFIKNSKVALSPNYDFNKNYPNCYILEYVRDEKNYCNFIEIKIVKIHKTGLELYEHSYNNYDKIKNYLEGKLQHIIININTFPKNSDPNTIITNLYDKNIKYMITLHKHKVKLLEKYSNSFKLYIDDEDLGEHIKNYLNGNTEYVLDTGELCKNISVDKLEECLIKNATMYEEYETYVGKFKDKYVIGFAIKAMFDKDENYVDLEGKDCNIYDELYVYFNGKIIKNENNSYKEIIKKWKNNDESVALDEWSFLGKFYDPNKFIDEYIKYQESKI